MAEEMASHISSLRTLLPRLSSSLSNFQSSSSKFAIIHSINPTPDPPQSPKTLFILDSSFNPPSIAHLAITKSILRSSSANRYPKPHRLLLLFSTHNADKAPSAASFPQRLALMTIFAEDLHDNLKNSGEDHSIPPVDIGLTTLPYYTDKTAAISAANVYPDKPMHIHMMGFDTITRFFAAKYYPNHDPPFSALAPYFEAGHRLRVTIRPDDEFGDAKTQRAFLRKLEDGEMEKDGGKREWAEQIEMVEPGEGVGVSSTKVRKAAKSGDWETVQALCTKGVMTWVKEEELYAADDRGAKMA
ncbi:hypothetical protein LTR66_009091 [Elasticomyces elasticus]|nr:hypothetical protein LTR66_009091 [Elasticomyces elasticus]